MVRTVPTERVLRRYEGSAYQRAVAVQRAARANVLRRGLARVHVRALLYSVAHTCSLLSHHACERHVSPRMHSVPFLRVACVAVFEQVDQVLQDARLYML